MNVDRTFSAPRESFAFVQTLGFTGAERSNGTQITVGGVPVVTPVANGGASGYWNNLLATQVAKALSESTAYKNLVIDVKENTVILIQPYSDGNFSSIAIRNESNLSIGMTLNGPSGWVNGVWNGENPWSNFLIGATTVPSLVEVNVYTFGFTGGERSNGSNVTVGGSTFTTPIANSSDSGKWNNELARLHVLALDSNEQYGSLASDGSLNTSIVVAPRTFKNASLNTFAGESSTIGVSLDVPSGYNSGVWHGENPWNNYFASYAFEPSNDVDEGGSAVFTLLTKNIPTDTSIAYVLSGIAAADIVGVNLTGSAVVNSIGKATITVPISADFLTEGAETLTVTAQGKTASVLVNDTSKTPLIASYALSASTNSVSEGSSAVFTLTTTNVAGGTSIPYTISGVSSADIVGGLLSGIAIVSSNGNAIISIPIASDQLTEGNETLTLTLTAQGNSSTISIIDTTPPIVDTTKGIAITRGPSNDLIQGSNKNDSIDGGAGTDTLLFTGNLSDYTITYNRALGAATVTDRRSAGDGIDSLTNIEKLQFADKTIELISPSLSTTPAYGKTPSFLFDPVFYLLKNPELIPTVSLSNAYSSYLQSGAALGESPNNWFDAAYYANRWPDLKPLNLDASTLFTHYNLYGVWEGRSAGPMFDKFDGTRYLRENPDVGAYVDAYVKDFLGSRINGAIAHYIIYGANESRKTYDTLGQLIDPSFTISTPTYNISTVTPSINEGSTASFNLTYVNATVGTEVGYTLSGINAADVTSGSLTGKVLIGASGQTTINIPISSDAITEGQETLTLSIKGVTASTVINDIPKGNTVQIYTLTSATTSINEGVLAQVYVSTTNVAAGTSLQFGINGVGITQGDVLGGLSGFVTVDSLGKAVININTVADQLTEGPETMLITLGTSKISLIINDTFVEIVGVEQPPAGP